jgi:LacI family gluconate utilization system Gnt-I transcriptional repressor
MLRDLRRAGDQFRNDAAQVADRPWLRAQSGCRVAASARTRAVGVLVPTVANAIFADTIQGISYALEPLGYAVFLAQSHYDDAREEKMLAALLGRRPEALIMVGSPATAAGSQMLRRARIPVVETWDLPVDPIDAVAGFDNQAAGAAVARHFASSGRRKLALDRTATP